MMRVLGLGDGKEQEDEVLYLPRDKKLWRDGK